MIFDKDDFKAYDVDSETAGLQNYRLRKVQI